MKECFENYTEDEKKELKKIMEFEKTEHSIMERFSDFFAQKLNEQAKRAKSPVYF